ncbi:hypothetical protein [Pseudonocardia sp. HH130630-07]|uniref:hypothetical protein n=1 Tax=Pseudonocardia sp. HH130630-07 TaxID=1690815 RepID=UPI000814F1A7|nr:hypothetical protein [Pseudonocardia sp. HH130630-07]ANY06022.1 hypothetical protein AFB00_06550 [Pseudonocardia sp. HH130630-07]
MGKRANIARTRYAAEASERELRRQTELAERLERTRRQGLSAQEREAEDAAMAEAQAVKAAQAQQSAVTMWKLFAAILGTVIAGSIAGAWGVLILWALMVVGRLLRKRQTERVAAQQRAEEQAAEAARLQDEEARRAQLQHHVTMLCRADPTFVGLIDEWNRIPPTRAADKARNESAQAERLVIIDQFAQQFAEYERTGRPVPDHGTTMRELVEAERAWDAQGRHRPR